jgi:hypothetical protein
VAITALLPVSITATASASLTLAGPDGKAATQVTLFDQGVLQTLQAAVTGLTVDDGRARRVRHEGGQRLQRPGALRIGREGQHVGLVIVEGKPGETGATVQTQAPR